ncbi:hypothetical protein BO99DRAFT_437906 [Aspergillus violaceofuscus CBS 115571]|uniref:Biogenesis of lysosome-related organelles complex 1 subunit 1 n=1 Tax=Aspergillus violaceofuscus (strain CBS 115571) TaxID=1450538 RepID=A0A2V5GZL3_ASPV1|nr:hypothetical protein BO99DRAFT_437906 [Aspergillus violaceofuscus CBS 115571]
MTPKTSNPVELPEWLYASSIAKQYSPQLTTDVTLKNDTPLPPAPPTTTTTTEATEARTAFTATLRSTAQTHETQLRERARILHDNASALERQEHALAGATAALAAQNAQLTKTADAARDALKEIGDVQNWAEVIERELLVVEETLRIDADAMQVHYLHACINMSYVVNRYAPIIH